jgi:hypothetical protein
MTPNPNMRVSFSPANRAWSIVWGDSFVRLEPIDAGGKMPLFFDRRAELVAELKRRGIEVLKGGVLRSKNPGSGIKLRKVRPSIDHSALSPSGKVSKRSRASALRRVSAELFPPGFWDRVPPGKTEKAKALIRAAKNLRELAARGMSPRKHVKEAARLESEAARIAGNPRAAARGRAEHRAPRSKRNPGIVDAIRPGDRVTIVDRFGKQRTGRAVMRGTHGGWVLNMGGAHGTPGLADDRNIVKVSPAKRTANPPPSLERGLKTFRKWHDFDAKRVTPLNGHRTPRVLVKLGDVPEIIYRSNKWGGTQQTYSHKCTRPYPTLATGESGRGLYLVGGRVKVTAAGLKH